MIHTFSPNWYRPQCLFATSQHLYYASNYLLYQYNLQLRKITSQLCLRQIAISQKLNFKDIKITSIIEHKSLQQSSKLNLYIGINQPYIFQISIDKNQFQIINIIKLIQENDKIQIIPDYIYCLNFQQLVICSIDNIYFLQQETKKLKYFNKIKCKNDRIKQIFKIGQGQNLQYYILVYWKGTIFIIDKWFKQIKKIINLQPKDTILSVDCIYCQKIQKYVICLLIRGNYKKNNTSYSLIRFIFQYHQQFNSISKNKLGQISQQFIQILFNYQYPKKCKQKIQNIQKAAISMKLLTGNQVMLSGKLGQIYTIHLTNIDTSKVLELRPYSDQMQSNYQVWIQSNHYKEIYSIKQCCKQLYLLSTDHNLSIWSHLQNFNVKYIYSIKFLTTGVNNIFFAECDPQTIFLLLKDSIIRSFSPLQQGSYHLNQYWKFTKKYAVIKASCHLVQPGVLGMISKQNKIIIYDIYEDRLMKMLELSQQAISISFEHISILQPLKQMYQNAPVQIDNSKYKAITLFSKQINNDIILLIQLKAHLLILSQLSNKNMVILQMSKTKKLQRINRYKYWNGQTLLSSFSKNNKLSLSIYHNNSIIQYQQDNINGRIIYKCPNLEHKLYILVYKGIKLKVQVFQFLENTLIKIYSKLINLQYPIDHIVMDYETYNVALYNQRDNYLQMVNIQQKSNMLDIIEQQQNQSIVKVYEYNTKIECLAFYMKQYLIIGSKDQAIKVIKYQQLPIYNKKLKNQKKNNQSLIMQVQLSNNNIIKQEKQKIEEQQNWRQKYQQVE